MYELSSSVCPKFQHEFFFFFIRGKPFETHRPFPFPSFRELNLIKKSYVTTYVSKLQDVNAREVIVKMLISTECFHLIIISKFL